MSKTKQAPADQDRVAAEDKAVGRMRKARTRMIFDRRQDGPFWATLAMRLDLAANWRVLTAGTDGKSLLVNPPFVESLTDDQLLGLLVHEVGHCAFIHHLRLNGRDPNRWNIAADLQLNPLLRAAGYVLPPDGLYAGEGPFTQIPVGLSTEETYLLLPVEEEEGDGDGEGEGEGESGGDGEGDGDGEGKGAVDPGKCGGVIQPKGMSAAEASRQSQNWKAAVAQARQIAKMRGAISKGLDRLIDGLLQPSIPWQQELAEFVTKMSKSDYRWSPPSRRFAWRRLYLPSIGGDALGEIVVAVDESGSIGQQIFNAFAAELSGICFAYADVSLTILHHDSAVCGVQRWTPSDGPLVLKPCGGGGTDHRPVFDWIENEGMDPACLICLTDMYSTFPAHAPDYPVLWASTTEAKGPWGRTIRVSV